MAPVPEAQTPSKPRKRWFKRIFIAVLGAAALLGLMVGGIWIYIRSESFNRLVEGEIKGKLREYGLRGEIGSFGVSWDSQTAKLRDLKVYNQQTGQLVATVERADTLIEVRDLYALKLSREVAVKKVDVEGVEVFFEIDRQGRTNWDGVHYAPPKSKRVTFDTSRLLTSLSRAAVHFKDQSRKIEADLANLKATVNPQPQNSKIFDLKLDSAGGRLSFEGRESSIEALGLVAQLSEKGAEIGSLRYKSNAADLDAKGRVADWAALDYDFDFDSQVRLDRTMRLLGWTDALSGLAAVNGRIEGKRESYRIRGRAGSADLKIAEVRLAGVQLPFSVEGKAAQLDFACNRIDAQSIELGDIRIGPSVVNDLKGDFRDGVTWIEAPLVTVTAVEWPESRLEDIKLSGVTGQFSKSAYEVKAGAALPSGQIADAKFAKATAQAVFDNAAIRLKEVKAEVYGGTVEAEYALPLAPGAAQTVKATFAGVETRYALELFDIKDLPVSGRINGEADLTLVGANLNTLNGSIKTRFDGASGGASDSLPITGDVAIRVANGVFNFDKLDLSTDASKLTATGSLSVEGESNLNLALNSTQAEQLLQLARSFEIARPYIEQYEPQLIGNFKLEGRVTGPIEKASIEADVTAETAGLRDAILGSLAGRVTFSPEEARVKKGLVSAPNGGSVRFELVAPLDKNAKSGRLDAVIDRISLETILAAAGSPSAEKFITGDISGEAHLTGLPADIEGDAVVNLINGKIADQSPELAVAEIRLEGRDAILERLEVRLPQSRITATGGMNLDDSAFQAGGKADQISLENIAIAFELKDTRIEGAADADFRISGKALTGNQAGMDWDNLKVEMTAQGRNVKVNGRDAGELKLTARTINGGRIEVDLLTGLLAEGAGEGNKGKPEQIKFSIETNKPGRPVTIQSDLVNLGIDPLLAIFAPELSEIIRGTITGKLLVEGPSTGENGEATLDRLRGGLTLTDVALTVADNPVEIETPATVALENTQIKIPNAHITGEGADLNVGGAIGFREDSAMNFTVNGTINFDRLPSVSTEVVLFGSMNIDAWVGGTFEKPNLGGSISVNDFGLSATDLPVFISGGAGTFTLAGNQIKLDRFAADANDGRLEVTGLADLENLRPKNWRYDIRVSNAVIAYREVTATVNGALALAGTPQGQTLSGQVTIPQAEYVPSFDIDNLAIGGSATGFAISGFAGPVTDTKQFGIPPINLNVRVEARDSLIIQNDQINTIGSQILTLTGPITNPDATGLITLDGGTWRFRGQRYEIVTGSLDLPPSGSSEPLLNLMAEGDFSGYRINIGLVGPLDDLDLILRSEPQLTRDEILSLITTGRTEAATLGSQDPLRSGVGAAASLISSGLISRPTEQLLGLSRFQIDPVIRPNANPAARLTVGQQFSRNMYLSYSTNLATEQDQTALAEYTLSNRFSTLATFTQGGSAARQGVREGVFTIELRGRQRFSLGFKPDLAAPPPDPLTRAARPRLPEAKVTVSEVQDLKLGQKRLRELLPVIREGFSRSLMRLGERRLREYLQESGYFFAEVKARCEPENCAGGDLRVLYEIEPNVIYDLKEIRIEGTDLVKLKNIQDELQSQTASALGGNPFLKNLPFIGGYVRGLTSNDRLNNDEELIRRKLVDIGYRNARVKSRLAVKPDSDDLIVVFDVETGEQSEIADRTVRGNVTIESSELLEVIPLQPGDAFSFTRMQIGTQLIRQLYAQRGYLQVNVEPEFVELERDRVRLVYNIDEGSRAVVTQVEINGTTKTGKGWVRRYFDFKQGDILTPAKIRQTQRDLYATNAFREVTLRAEPLGGDDGSAHKVSVNLTEAKPLLFIYGLGYSTDDGARGLMEVANTNLGGSLDALSLRLRGSRRDQFAQVSFTDLRPFGWKFPTTFSVFYNRSGNLRPFVRRRLVDNRVEDVKDSGTFGLERFAAFVQTERKLNERTSMRFRYNIERASLFNLEDIPETAVTRNERSIRLGLFSAGISRDTRDSVLNPTRGQLFSADHSVAARIFGGTETFNKFFASYQRYKTFDQFTPLLGDTTLAFSARIGLSSTPRAADCDGDGAVGADERCLPISERFFSGGATTLRGFRFETAGPQIVLEPRPDRPGELPTLVATGGDALAVFNLEMRYPLTSRLRLVPFYDLGNVFRRVSDFSFSRMTNTMGVGLRINTPLGPVGVDYGFLIDPPSFLTLPDQNMIRATLRQPRGAIHIRFGQTF